MGFGFSGLGRALLKNNSRRISKHDAFDERRQKITKYRRIKTFKATPRILKRIKAKIQTQNKIENRVYISVVLATLFFVVYLFVLK